MGEQPRTALLPLTVPDPKTPGSSAARQAQVQAQADLPSGHPKAPSPVPCPLLPPSTRQGQGSQKPTTAWPTSASLPFTLKPTWGPPPQGGEGGSLQSKVSISAAREEDVVPPSRCSRASKMEPTTPCL